MDSEESKLFRRRKSQSQEVEPAVLSWNCVESGEQPYVGGGGTYAEPELPACMYPVFIIVSVQR